MEQSQCIYNQTVHRKFPRSEVREYRFAHGLPCRWDTFPCLREWLWYRRFRVSELSCRAWQWLLRVSYRSPYGRCRYSQQPASHISNQWHPRSYQWQRFWLVFYFFWRQSHIPGMNQVHLKAKNLPSHRQQGAFPRRPPVFYGYVHTQSQDHHGKRHPPWQYRSSR